MLIFSSGARYKRIRKRPRGKPSPQLYRYKYEKLQPTVLQRRKLSNRSNTRILPLNFDYLLISKYCKSIGLFCKDAIIVSANAYYESVLSNTHLQITLQGYLTFKHRERGGVEKRINRTTEIKIARADIDRIEWCKCYQH